MLIVVILTPFSYWYAKSCYSACHYSTIILNGVTLSVVAPVSSIVHKYIMMMKLCTNDKHTSLLCQGLITYMYDSQRYLLIFYLQEKYSFILHLVIPE